MDKRRRFEKVVDDDDDASSDDDDDGKNGERNKGGEMREIIDIDQKDTSAHQQPENFYNPGLPYKYQTRRKHVDMRGDDPIYKAAFF